MLNLNPGHMPTLMLACDFLIQNGENQNNQLSQTKTRNRKPELSLSEAITIAIIFHKTGYRTFKDYYIHKKTEELRKFA